MALSCRFSWRSRGQNKRQSLMIRHTGGLDGRPSAQLCSGLNYKRSTLRKDCPARWRSPKGSPEFRRTASMLRCDRCVDAPEWPLIATFGRSPMRPTTVSSACVCEVSPAHATSSTSWQSCRTSRRWPTISGVRHRMSPPRAAYDSGWSSGFPVHPRQGWPAEAKAEAPNRSQTRSEPTFSTASTQSGPFARLRRAASPAPFIL